MRRINIILVVTLAAIISFAGCKKAEDINNSEMPLKAVGTQPGIEASTTIRTFATFALLDAEVAKTIEFSYDDLVTYEQSIRFNSYGKVADQRMVEVLKEVDYYETMSDTVMATTMVTTMITQLLNQHSAYIHMVSDENGEQSCETKYFKSLYRYVMNMNRMFKVDTLYFKVFEGGHASCGASNYNALSNLTEQQFVLLDENDPIFDVFKYDDGGRGFYTYLYKKETSGKNRVQVSIEPMLYSKKYVGNGNWYIRGGYYVKTWGQHKTFGIWWNVKHNYTNDLTAKIAVGYSLRTGTDKGTTYGYKREKWMLYLDETAYYYENPEVCISTCSGYGKTPGITCYMNYN